MLVLAIRANKRGIRVRLWSSPAPSPAAEGRHGTYEPPHNGTRLHGLLQRIVIIQLAQLMRFSSSLASDCKKSSKFGRLRLKGKFRLQKRGWKHGGKI
jgi:hypothetical protein